MASPGKKKNPTPNPPLEKMSEQALEESIDTVASLEAQLDPPLQRLNPQDFQGLGTITDPIVTPAVTHYNAALDATDDRPQLFALRLSLNADESALTAESSRLATGKIKFPSLGGLTRPQRKAKVDQVHSAVVNMLEDTDRRLDALLVVPRDKTRLRVPANIDLTVKGAAELLGKAPACRIGTVVLKKESTDKPEQKGRMAANDDLAAALLLNAPTSRALDAREIAALSDRMPKQETNRRQINTAAFWFFPNNVDPNDIDLPYPLVKIMDFLATGPSLKDIWASKAKQQVEQLYSSNILGQLGQMALFDRITDNNDRFPGRAELEQYAQSDTLDEDISILRNIEFIADMRGIAPLDNAHPDSPNSNRAPQDQVGDPEKRGAYAHAFISVLSKHVSPPPGGKTGFDRCVADFLNGMERGLRDARVVARMLGDPPAYPADIAQAARTALNDFIEIVTGTT